MRASAGVWFVGCPSRMAWAQPYHGVSGGRPTKTNPQRRRYRPPGTPWFPLAGHTGGAPRAPHSTQEITWVKRTGSANRVVCVPLLEACPPARHLFVFPWQTRDCGHLVSAAAVWVRPSRGCGRRLGAAVVWVRRPYGCGCHVTVAISGLPSLYDCCRRVCAAATLCAVTAEGPLQGRDCGARCVGLVPDPRVGLWLELRVLAGRQAAERETNTWSVHPVGCAHVISCAWKKRRGRFPPVCPAGGNHGVPGGRYRLRCGLVCVGRPPDTPWYGCAQAIREETNHEPHPCAMRARPPTRKAAYTLARLPACAYTLALLRLLCAQSPTLTEPCPGRKPTTVYRIVLCRVLNEWELCVLVVVRPCGRQFDRCRAGESAEFAGEMGLVAVASRLREAGERWRRLRPQEQVQRALEADHSSSGLRGHPDLFTEPGQQMPTRPAHLGRQSVNRNATMRSAQLTPRPHDLRRRSWSDLGPGRERVVE
nr:hypothetical protein [Kibdelosporangium sp. MJ126-NF4]